jgi:hypothetical protein
MIIAYSGLVGKAGKASYWVSASEALARRDRIAKYLDSQGKDTAVLCSALSVRAQVERTVETLDFSMTQLWSAM